MSKAELRVSYQPDSDWDGALRAVVTSGAFAGEGSIWISPNTVKETFVAALNAYPLSPDNPPVLEPGYESESLRVAVRPYNAVGTLLVEVDLVSDVGLQQSVTARFVTEYTALQKFASGLERALDGDPEPAVLVGTAG